MDQTIYGRTLMGDSLGFHILFALLGVGIPLLISLAELLGILKKDNTYLLMARRWSFLMVTLFVVGAISGMIISNQLSILWPNFMTIAGRVVGPAFYMETFAFFLEAIFLGIYLYSWDRFANQYVHWLCSLPIVIGSAASAFFITSANAWMNSPAGFSYQNGVVSNVNPIAAIFNHALWTETTHSISAYYLTTCLCFAGAYAFFLLRKKYNQNQREYFKKALTFCMWLSLVFGVLINATGDTSARYVGNYEPIKFAAAESLFQSQANAPLSLFGIHFPGLLSVLLYGSQNAVVQGLNAFNPDLWPPLWIHTMFDLMVVIGIVMTAAIGLFLFFFLFRRRWAFSKPVLLFLFLNSFLGFFAVEFGWILTEVGRQPFAINGVLTTAAAFTTNPNVAIFGFIFPTLYLILFILTPWILIRHYKKNPLLTS